MVRNLSPKKGSMKKKEFSEAGIIAKDNSLVEKYAG
jgi:hypothetical protein